VPWITFNGEDIPDSQFCIEYLGKKFDKDLSKPFSARDQGAARAFLKMTEESLFWISGLDRFVFHPNPSRFGLPASFLLLKMMARRYRKTTFYQGYGRHTEEEG
jgi:hypothetical protein